MIFFKELGKADLKIIMVYWQIVKLVIYRHPKNWREQKRKK